MSTQTFEAHHDRGFSRDAITALCWFHRMKYTAYQHRAGVIKVETKARVICDCIGDLETAELIAAALNAYDPNNDPRKGDIRGTDIRCDKQDGI